MDYDFTWRDGERTIRFGRGAILEAPGLIGEGFTLISTVRARGQYPNIELGAERVIDIGQGFVDEIAGDLLANGPLSTKIVALGGGRVIDTAKALGAASTQPTFVAAIPTTLSAAEMTWFHRQARGAPPSSSTMRPQLVINDPALSASQTMPDLARSAANSLGHAIEAAVIEGASPVPTMAAVRAAVLLAEGLPEDGEPLRDKLALGSLLSGYALTSAGLHHVMCQTLVRAAGASHAAANAAMLPVTSAALRERLGEKVAALDRATGVAVEELARRFARRAQAQSLRAIGISEDILPHCAELASQRGELSLTPPAANAEELLKLYRAAW